MQVKIRGRLIAGDEHGDGTVTLDLPIHVEYIRFPKDLQMEDPETKRTRPMNRDEVQDFENAMDSFQNRRLAAAIAELVEI